MSSKSTEGTVPCYMKALQYPEKSRKYTFPCRENVLIEDVTELGISVSGTHRLKTGNGSMHIVPTGWLHIEINADGWSA